MEQEKIMTIHCASCGAPAQYDIVKQNYHCPNVEKIQEQRFR